MQKKLEPGELLDEQGNLAQAGYAMSLVKKYDREKIQANPLRIKEWDYYLIYNPHFGVALTVDDNSYMGLMRISFLDFDNRTERTVSPMTVFPMGKTDLPPDSRYGETRYRDRKCYFSFQAEEGRRVLRAWMQDFEEQEPIRMKIILDEEPRDSMVIATPFEKEKAFYYNQKIIGMRAKGVVEYKGRRHYFSRENSFGLLDWGRGVWTYSNTWYWSAMQGLIDGKVFGFNLGYGFGDTSAASENMLFYDGHAHKLNQVRFHIPGEKEHKEQYLKPWYFTSSDDRLDLTFTPVLDRKAYTSAGIILSDQHQVFGHFDGTAVLDDGKKLEIRHMLGFAEKVRNKW